MLHHAQQVEEATTAEEGEWLFTYPRLLLITGSDTDSEWLYCITRPHHWKLAEGSYLLVNALLEGVSQQPPVLPDIYQTLDFISQLQIFTVQTLQGQKACTRKQVTLYKQGIASFNYNVWLIIVSTLIWELRIKRCHETVETVKQDSLFSLRWRRTELERQRENTASVLPSTGPHVCSTRTKGNIC